MPTSQAYRYEEVVRAAALGVWGYQITIVPDPCVWSSNLHARTGEALRCP